MLDTLCTWMPGEFNIDIWQVWFVWLAYWDIRTGTEDVSTSNWIHPLPFASIRGIYFVLFKLTYHLPPIVDLAFLITHTNPCSHKAKLLHTLLYWASHLVEPGLKLCFRMCVKWISASEVSIFPKVTICSYNYQLAALITWWDNDERKKCVPALD